MKSNIGLELITGDNFYFGNCIRIINGNYNCNSSETFNIIRDNYSLANENEKSAAKNFIKDMNKKYGKNNHNYKLNGVS